MVEITHTGTGVDDLELQGSVVGGTVRKAGADPETVTTVADPHSATTIISVESGRSHNKVLAVAALVVGIASLSVAIFGTVTGWIDWGPFTIGAIVFFAVAFAINFYVAKRYPPSGIKLFDSDL